MGNQSIQKQFLKYVSFNVISMIGLSCYILADTIFIARGVGNNGLTALNLVLPVYSVVNGIGLMLGMGGANRYSILCGQQEYQKGSGIFTNTVYLAILFGAIFTTIGLFFSEQLARLLGADPVVLQLSSEYLKTILLFSFAFIINNVFVCFVRNDNNPKLSMAAMLIGSFSNIILDYIFIFPLQLGMLGAALATGLAPIISMFVLSLHFIQKRNRFKFTKVAIQLTSVKRILSLGTPSFITEVSSGIVMLIFNFSILNLAGNIGVASYGIIANLSLIMIAIFTGVAQGIQPLVSVNHGSGSYGNIKKIFRNAIMLALVIGVVFYFLLSMAPMPIIEIFNKDNNSELTSLTTIGIQLYFVSLFFAGFNIVSTSVFASLNQTKKAFIISIVRGFLFVIPLVLILSALFGMTGVWLVIPCTELATVLLGIILYHKEYKKLLLH
jgi:putative MATE family efflux protein